MRICLWSRVVGVLALLVTGGLAWGVQEASPSSDPAFQAAIAAFADAESGADRGQALGELLALDEPPYHRLVREVVLHSSQAADVKNAMTGGVILGELKLSDRDLVEAVMPLLGSNLPDEVAAARGALEGVEDRSAGRRPDFSTYRAILEERIRAKQELPAPFVRYIYEAHPGEALLAMMRAQQLREPAELKEILWAEHVVSDTLWKQRYGFLAAETVEPEAADQLARLAGHPQWWVRLYVVEIMRQHGAFHQAEHVEKLQDDAHELVRARAMEVAQGPSVSAN